jgi:hypothetical protein
MSLEQIPQNQCKDITYSRLDCADNSEKKDLYNTRITIGGNLINYPDDCNLLTVKLMLNSIISTPGAKFLTMDIKDFHLMTPIDRSEYFCMKLELFSPVIINEYRLHEKVDADGNVFRKV